ncbi:DUF3108 domain-containing protein [Pseudoduganella ginsengisoli]|uniref:DUF3108 domain-containing protein n=1 Tax=Pseudoduganella ginsengisoli TaxID=1462440 RepID=UPI00353168C5
MALHFVTIDWLGSRLGAQPAAPLKPSVATVRLPLPEQKASGTPPPDLAPSQPPAMPQHARKAKPVPLPQPDAAVALPPDNGALSGPQAVVEQAVAALPMPQIEPEPAPPAPQAAPAQEPTGTRRYQVNIPPSATFDLELTRTDAKGANWNASGKMVWQTDGSKYKVTVEAGLSMLVARVNLLELNSEGDIDDAGIAPREFTEKRRGRAMTATHFQRNEGRITFSASERSYPLLTGAQDRATIPFQLAAIGRANVNQMGGDIDILVSDNREAAIYRFQLVGEEEIDTKMGRLITWHVSRPPKPGSYSARLDIWLAPSLQWFPVQIRNTEANGALTTQTVSKISLNNVKEQ